MGCCSSKPQTPRQEPPVKPAAPAPAPEAPQPTKPGPPAPEPAKRADAPSHPPLHPSDIKIGWARDFDAHYEYGRQLGHGSFGVVRLARMRTSGEEVAVKIIPKKSLMEEGLVDELKQEVEIMKRLSKALNVINCYDTFEDDRNVMLVLEYCKGGELYQRLTRENYTEKTAAKVIRSILKMVAACHAAGIIHRDLKPDNFLFLNDDPDAPMKAIDFGLACFYQPGQVLTETSGTPYYMAPEVVRHAYGPSADLWSVGVIMYQLLSGKLPFRDDSGASSLVVIFRKILQGKYDVTSDPWPHISASAKDLLRQLLNRNPKARPTALQALEHPWVSEGGDASEDRIEGNVVQRLQQFSTYTAAKQSSLQLFAQKLAETDDQYVMELRDMFHEVDTNHDGYIDLKEFVEGLNKKGFKLTDKEVVQLQKEMDLDGDGRVNYSEFITTLFPWKVVQKSGRWEKYMHKMFVELDKDGDGVINPEEISAYMRAQKEQKGEAATSQHYRNVVLSVINEADKDKDGGISFQEFQEVVQSDQNTMPVHAYDARM
eukprot:jgi/Mesvir1/7918/Mv11843-RA.1